MNFEVVDLFAGPGGLGEGFSSYLSSNGEKPFKLVVSVEKEQSAHKTLTLRAFFRTFKNAVPAAYYDYVKGVISLQELMAQYPDNWKQALSETLEKPRTLGDSEDDAVLFARLQRLKSNKIFVKALSQIAISNVCKPHWNVVIKITNGFCKNTYIIWCRHKKPTNYSIYYTND